MNQLWKTRISRLIFAVLLVPAAGCAKLAKVRDVHQEIAIDRRGVLVVIPLASTVSLCDINFDEGELEGAREYFTELVEENLNHSFSKEINVIHPKAVAQFLQQQGHDKSTHFDKLLAMKIARMIEAQIVVFGHVKVDPIFEESAFGKTKRYDVDFEVYIFDVTNDERLATLRCAGKRKNVLKTIPWLISNLNFYPPVKPPAKPVPKPPKEEKKKEEKNVSQK